MEPPQFDMPIFKHTTTKKIHLDLISQVVQPSRRFCSTLGKKEPCVFILLLFKLLLYWHSTVMSLETMVRWLFSIHLLDVGVFTSDLVTLIDDVVRWYLT